MMVWKKVHGIITLRCKDITRLMSDSVERPLTLVEQLYISWHKLHCNPCKEYEHHIHILHKAMLSYTRTTKHDYSPETSAKLSDDLLPSLHGSQLSDKIKTSIKERLQRELDGTKTSDFPDTTSPQ